MGPNAGSVSLMIARARLGDQSAIAGLHSRYWSALVGLARKRINRSPVADRDAEDIAQDAFISVYEALTRGKLPRLNDRHQWLAFLTHLVGCRVVNEFQRHQALKRGGGRVKSGISGLLAAGTIDPANLPDHQALLADCYNYYLKSLPDHLQRFAEMHLAGLSINEIADELGCVRRTVERKMRLLEGHWAKIASESRNRPTSGIGNLSDRMSPHAD